MHAGTERQHVCVVFNIVSLVDADLLSATYKPAYRNQFLRELLNEGDAYNYKQLRNERAVRDAYVDADDLLVDEGKRFRIDFTPVATPVAHHALYDL